MPIDNNYSLVKKKLRELSNQSPDQWGILEESDFKSLAEYLHWRKDRYKLETKHVLQAGMLLRYIGSRVSNKELFLSWLRNDTKYKSINGLLVTLRELVLGTKYSGNDFETKTTESYGFYMDKTQLHDENLRYAKKVLTVKKIQQILDTRAFSKNNLETYAPLIIELLCEYGIETFDMLPKNIYEFLAAYLNSLYIKDKITTSQTLLAGILLRSHQKHQQAVEQQYLDMLVAIATHETISLKDILKDKSAYRLYPKLADTLIANLNYLVEHEVCDSDGKNLSKKFTGQLQEFLLRFSRHSRETFENHQLKEIFHFLLRCKLSKNMVPAYKELWLSTVVHLSRQVSSGDGYSDFLIWANNYIQVETNYSYSSHLLEQINKIMPQDVKNNFFEMLRVNIKEHLQVYPANVVDFLHAHRVLNKPGSDMDLYFKEDIMNDRDIQRKEIAAHKISANDPGSMFKFITKVITEANKSQSVLRFNLAAIVKYVNQTGFYKFGNLYFSIKERSRGVLTLYSPNLKTGPEDIGFLDFKKFEAFIFRVCNSVSGQKIKILELLPVQYELEIASRSRPITPMPAYESSKKGGVQMVRSNSERNVYQAGKDRGRMRII
jgi:hypothetical protein